MTRQKQKIVQYLNAAHGSELALVRQMQAQIAMTPEASTATGWRLTSNRENVMRMNGPRTNRCPKPIPRVAPV